MSKTKYQRGLCVERGCYGRRHGWGRCTSHQAKFWRETRLMDPEREPRCEICDGPHHAFGWCMKHYKAFKYWGDPTYRTPPMPKKCKVKGCPRKPRRTGHCNMHHLRIVLHGDPLVRAKRGVKPTLLSIPQEIRELASAYVYSYQTGAPRTEEMRRGHAEYQRLRNQLKKEAA